MKERSHQCLEFAQCSRMQGDPDDSTSTMEHTSPMALVYIPLFELDLNATMGAVTTENLLHVSSKRLGTAVSYYARTEGYLEIGSDNRDNDDDLNEDSDLTGWKHRPTEQACRTYHHWLE